ncbi:MAG TPA: sigma-70 family RNA polymerase sigma factor [Thermoanaerobaculia bacterium]|nr:sigma-70 family RNA polymerase sigma factor [Thermoanaerobaculia bacterium]
MAPTDELQLLRMVAAKDRKAFEALYALYYRRLFAYLFKLTRRAELIEEVLNDVMLVVWTRAASFDGRSRASTWIFGIAYHKAMKALGQRRAGAGATELNRSGGGDSRVLDEKYEPIDAEEPESLLARRELASTLGRALGALSPEQRSVVELTYYYGLSYQEIADIVDCPVNTVKTRMFHARRRLRQVLPAMGVSSHAG